jgi:hypothetical protein
MVNVAVDLLAPLNTRLFGLIQPREAFIRDQVGLR